MSTQARLFVISGPSGAGKSSLIADALKNLKKFTKSVSATTRSKRAGETDGEQYFFISEKKFDTMAEDGQFLEWASYAGDKYGTPGKFVKETLAAGMNVILEIEVQGAMQVMEKAKDAYFIFIMTNSLNELKRRLEGRCTDCSEEIDKRVRIAAGELDYKKHYDCIIVNNNYNEALQNLISVLTRESGKESKR